MWGERLATPTDAATGDAISLLMTTLEALDFAPERLAADEIGLRNCPFLELADPARDVVCPVHLGLMRGVLDSLDTRWDVVRLEPFARPELCVAHLAERSAA